MILAIWLTDSARSSEAGEPSASVQMLGIQAACPVPIRALKAGTSVGSMQRRSRQADMQRRLQFLLLHARDQAAVKEDVLVHIFESHQEHACLQGQVNVGQQCQARAPSLSCSLLHRWFHADALLGCVDDRVKAACLPDAFACLHDVTESCRADEPDHPMFRHRMWTMQ